MSFKDYLDHDLHITVYFCYRKITRKLTSNKNNLISIDISSNRF